MDYVVLSVRVLVSVPYPTRINALSFVYLKISIMGLGDSQSRNFLHNIIYQHPFALVNDLICNNSIHTSFLEVTE
jgi:hypothetical protein